MLKGSSCCDSLLRIFIKEELDELLSRLGYAFPLAITELVITAHVSVKDLFRCVSFEERPASEDDIEDYSNTENVSLAVVALFLEELWGDVAGGSTPKVELLSRVLDDSRQAKVCNLQVPVVILGGKKEVLWLEVAVNNTVSV